MKKRSPRSQLHSIKRQISLAAVGALILLIVFVTTYPPSKSTYHSLFLHLHSNDTAARHLLALTRRPHVAGSEANAAAAAYVLETFSSASISTHIVSYDVLLSYPVYRYLSLASDSASPSVSFDLVQEIYSGDPYADVASEVLPTFHAYARSGSTAGQVVYANYGRVEDFAKLRACGVDVTGSVVLARYGAIFRGDIIRNAQLAGAVAAIVYTDAKDYGGGGRGKWFPNERWMPPSGVQVGSVFRGLGDPTTPGWASVSECERVEVEEVVSEGLMPGIPSLPVSSRDGEAILRTIGGQVAAEDWQGEEGAPVYRLGPGPGFVNMTYLGNETIMTIQNVIAVIKGKEEPDRGWKPRRTIVFCNWDAEEYHLLGSTEWVEDNREMLASRAVAYLNVDCGVSGPGFHASSTPQLDKLLKEASKKVQDPDNSSQSLYESWVSSDSPLIGRLGGGGTDFAAFIQHVGVPSIDMRFGRGYPVYHSMYDDFVWMQKFGDPLFHRHVAAASILGLVALKLADEEFLPFDYMSYASELQQTAKVLEGELLGMPVSTTPLSKSIEDFKMSASRAESQRKELETKNCLTKWKKDPIKVRELNDRLMLTERAFTDREGLFGRPWYKHLIYGPSQNNGYGSISFPGIDDAVEKAKTSNTSNSWQSVQHEIWRVARVITQASHVLKGELT